MTPTRFSLAFLMSATLIGCGDKSAMPSLTPAKVLVTLNGVPLPKAQVTFTSKLATAGSQASATGVTDDAGYAVLECGKTPGACLGPNLVTVSEGPLPEETRGEDQQGAASQYLAKLKNRPIPAKYQNAIQSGLTQEVKKDVGEYKVELTR